MRGDHLTARVAPKNAKCTIGREAPRTDPAVVERAELLPAVAVLLVGLDQLFVRAERQRDTASARCRVSLEEEASEEVGRPVLDRDVGDQVRMGRRGGGCGRRGPGGGGVGRGTLDSLLSAHNLLPVNATNKGASFCDIH